MCFSFGFLWWVRFLFMQIGMKGTCIIWVDWKKIKVPGVLFYSLDRWGNAYGAIQSMRARIDVYRK